MVDHGFEAIDAGCWGALAFVEAGGDAHGFEEVGVDHVAVFVDGQLIG